MNEGDKVAKIRFFSAQWKSLFTFLLVSLKQCIMPIVNISYNSFFYKKNRWNHLNTQKSIIIQQVHFHVWNQFCSFCWDSPWTWKDWI